MTPRPRPIRRAGAAAADRPVRATVRAAVRAALPAWRGRRGAAFVLVAGAFGGVTACGGTASPAGDGSSASASASSSGSATTPAASVRTLRITVTGKQVTPAPARVQLSTGAHLRLVITVDHDDEVHVHGFEVEREATAGKPVTIDLTGGEPGLYEVETHHPSLRLLQVLVR